MLTNVKGSRKIKATKIRSLHAPDESDSEIEVEDDDKS
jgi:hypothetical protein